MAALIKILTDAGYSKKKAADTVIVYAFPRELSDKEIGKILNNKAVLSSDLLIKMTEIVDNILHNSEVINKLSNKMTKLANAERVFLLYRVLNDAPEYIEGTKRITPEIEKDISRQLRSLYMQEVAKQRAERKAEEAEKKQKRLEVLNLIREGLTSSDPYDILEVKKEASLRDLTVAYRSLARKLHPDKNLDKTKLAEEVFKMVSMAYEEAKKELESK